MNVILVDDEQLALDFMEHHLNKIDNIEIKGKYSNPLIAKEAIFKEPIDIVFLDINLPEMTGLELAEILLEKNPYLHVVFVTAYDEHALEAFELNALDYIVKPVGIDRLKKTIERVEHLLNYQENQPGFQQTVLRINVCRQLMIENPLGQFTKVSWRTARAQELFLYLLLKQGLFVSKSQLIEMLWPDFKLERAYSQLYSTIYLIRKRLLEYDGHFELKNMTEGYLFLTTNVQVDIVEWERQIKKAPPIDTKTINHHVEIMELYTGSYLADYEYLWVEAERYRLEQLWIDSTFKIADWYYQHGHLNEAREHYKKISDAHPEMEDASFKQMKINARLGNHVMVYQLYDQLEEVLKEELDLPPRADISEWFREWNSSL